MKSHQNPCRRQATPEAAAGGRAALVGAIAVALLVATSIPLVLGGCLTANGEAGSPPGRRAEPIIGGESTTSYPAVGLIELGAARCTATLVADRVMLTAAHCVYDEFTEGRSMGEAFFGPSRSTADSVAIEDVIPHYLYRPDHIREADIALVRLSEAPPGDIAPMAWNAEPLPGDLLGTPVTLVGYGVTDGESQTGAGVKREVELTLDEIDGALLGVGDETANICQGDSGGPTILDLGGVPTVVAVSSFGSNYCKNRSYVSRTDADPDFIEEVVAAWSGPCKNDIDCVETGCGDFPDPDCDVCGLEGVCGKNCPRRDLDCEQKALPGDLCTSDDDCELGMCVPAEDDPEYSICSEVCDPAQDGEDCSRDLDACVERDGVGTCVFSGITPGIQGAPCKEPGDCGSGICDTGNKICVYLCDGECPAPYACVDLGQAKVCTIPDDGCCNLAGHDRGPSLTTLILGALVILFLWRPRRQVR